MGGSDPGFVDIEATVRFGSWSCRNLRPKVFREAGIPIVAGTFPGLSPGTGQGDGLALRAAHPSPRSAVGFP
jgi:hypothetical protein